DENGNEVFIPGIKTVSLNFFGFGAEVLDEMERGFTKMLDEKLDLDPLLCEYGLPSVADSILASGSGGVSVLSTDSRWLGVTYAEDMPKVRSEIAEMKKRDEYPADLWKRGS
ncbi:MAG: nucleotidyltransferase, partial [Defluviitaleaceae bacterium]|nr:nucleotidyltransferase [Defluviitaleaceae bacterium]